MFYRIGIDPGNTGAIAFLAFNVNQAPQVKTVTDLPLMAMGKNKKQVNAAELAKLINSWKYNYIVSKKVTSLTAYLEQVSAMPGQGVTSMFNFGMGYGVIQGVLAALNIPLVTVTPNHWKKNAGLLKTDKDRARTLAQQRFPDLDLGLKKHVGRADAILIALYGDK